MDYFAILPVARLQNLAWQDDRKMINLKGFRRKCSWFNQNTVPAFA
jgi:hypothetical protein